MADTTGYTAGLTTASKQTTAFGADVERVQERMGSGWKPTSQGLREVDNSLLAARDRFRNVGNDLSGVGSQLNRGVTLPLTLAGAASFKLAKDFGTTFTQMATLAGVPAGELDGLKQKVLDLAGETAQAPQALADALYQIYSSGVPASQAMTILDASAKASAIGMGDAAGIANALTSAINVYGAENLTAAQAADQLAQAVALGKGEAADFAPQLGNLLPLAKELGITFEQTVGSLAFLTRTNGDAARSSTMLQGVLQKLIKPTEQGQKALDGVGASAERLKQIVAEEGLPAGLQYLEEAFAGNSRAMAKFFDDSEGYVGALQLLDEGGKGWNDTLSEMAKSQGLVAKGMAILQDTDEFKAAQALAELQAAAVEVGTQLMPILTKLAGGIAALASVFGKLPAPVQTGLVVLGLFAAALGPVVSLAGNGAKAIGLFTAAMNAKALDSFRLGLMGLTESGAGASNALGGLLASAGGAAVVLPVVGAAALGAGMIMWDAKVKAEQFAGSMKAIREEAAATGRTDLSVFADSVAKLFAEVEGGFNIGESDNGFRKVLEVAGVSLDELTTALAGTDKEWEAFVDRVTEAAVKFGGSSAAGPLIEDLKALRAGQQQAAETTDAVTAAERSMAAATQDAADEQAGLTTETAKATDALSKQADEILGVFDAQRAALDAGQAYNDSIVAVAEAQQAERDAAEAVTVAEGELAAAHERAAEQAAANAKAVRDAERALEAARRGREQAVRNLQQAEADAADAAEAVTAALEDLAVAEREATGDSDAYRDAIDRVEGAEQALSDRQEDSLTAQQNLTAAREDYGRVLAGLARDAGGAADDVLTAEIRLRDAQQALADLGKPDKDGKVEPVTADERLAAEIAIREAQRRLEEAKERAAEAQAEYARNEAAGVEGSDAVVAAHEAVETAADNEATAEEDLAAARENVTAVQEAAAQRVVDAQGRVEDAINDRIAADQRVSDAVVGVEEANGRIADAVLGVEAATIRAKKGTDDVATAQANLAAKKDAVVAAHAEVEKKIDDVRDAALEAAVAVFALDQKTGNAAGGAANLAGKFRELADKLGPDDPLRQYLLDTAAKLDGIAGVYDVQLNLTAFEDSSFAALVSLGPARPGAANAERRALGGDVKAGRWYVVGEEGPELWKAPGDGVIVPAGPTAAIRAGWATSASTASPWAPTGLNPGRTPDAAPMPVPVPPSQEVLDYERLAELIGSAAGLTVHAPIDARGIQNVEALASILAARIGLEFRTEYA